MSTQEPAWGGAEATPDPPPDPTTASRPDRSPGDPAAKALGGRDTVTANDELDGGASRHDESRDDESRNDEDVER